MRISRLQQALCTDRTRTMSGPDPNEWIQSSLPTGWHKHSFHFFVNWEESPLRVGDRVWMTRAVHFDPREDPGSVERAELEELLRSCEAWQEYQALQRVLPEYGFRLQLVLLPEMPVTALKDTTCMWVGSTDGKGTFTLSEHSLADLKVVIRHESGGPVRVGQKGLTYGTSGVECYLAKSDSAYPGDADCVVVDDTDRVRCVIEYKKHTLPDVIGAHLINRYYPKPDGRKYQRLDALVRRLQGQSSSPTFVILYYSTKKPEGRLQEIGELARTRAMVVRDSGELSFYDRDPRKVGKTIMQWLGIAE